MTEIEIRPARPDDLTDIHRLIVELAEYEHAADQVSATEEDLRAALFADHPAAHCQLATRRGEILGIALWFLNFSTWEGRHGIYLEDLVVTKSARKRGTGLALMRSLAAICVEKDYRRLEWSVLKWNTPSIDFYRSIGALPQDEWDTYRLTGEALGELGRA